MPFVLLLLMILTTASQVTARPDNPMSVASGPIASTTIAPYFGLYFFETVQFESGTAFFVFGKETISTYPVPLNSLLSVGSVIQTPSDKLAQVRLGCGSFLRLAPDTRLIIGSDSFELTKGSLLVRHVASPDPVTVRGQSNLEVLPETLVEIECLMSQFLMRVQVGGISSPNSPEIHKAPEKIAASGEIWKPAILGPGLRGWDEPSICPVERKLASIPEEPDADFSWGSAFSEVLQAVETYQKTTPENSGDAPAPDQGRKNIPESGSSQTPVKTEPFKTSDPEGDPDASGKPPNNSDRNLWPTSPDSSQP